MATRSSTSYVRDQIEALKVQKKLEREVEKALTAKKEAEDAEKQRVSDHRIATKMARINGTEPPPPLEKAEPVVEAVVEETVQETVQPEPEPVKEDVVKKTKAKKPSRSKK
jgi:3-hydroxyacyl-CoA dehydrogenase|tara:strand:+ start:310 stop:642 length:333 start_codon:yes stop_codon:yes gene_type:complete